MKEKDIRLLMEVSKDSDLRQGWMRGVEVQRSPLPGAGEGRETMQAKGLKPCPFCGGQAAVAKGTQWMPPKQWHIVYCKECTAGTGEYSTEQLAKDAWNARSTAKPKAMYVGFNSHDAETRYRCPICEKPFGSWTIYGNKPNKNGSKHYCPHCETELEGLE